MLTNDHADHHNRGRPNSILPDEKVILHQRHVEAAELRQAMATANLVAALRLGAALKQRKDEA